MAKISLIWRDKGRTKGGPGVYEVSRVPSPGEELEIKVDERDVSYQVIQVRHVANPTPGDADAFVVIGDVVEKTF